MLAMLRVSPVLHRLVSSGFLEFLDSFQGPSGHKTMVRMHHFPPDYAL
jgi:hypothetical protein